MEANSTQRTETGRSDPTRAPLRAICLDGGGYMGLATASFLEEAERHFRTSCANQFSLFVGTSTGGIIALALASGMSAKDIVDLYCTLGSKVFRNRWSWVRWLRALRSVVTSRYRSTALRGALTDAFGNTRLGDLRARGKSVVIPAFCITDGRPRLFKTNHSPELTLHDDYRLVDVALATSAAPTFLPIVSLQSPTTGAHERFVDGGIYANNPAFIAYTEALRYLGEAPDNVQILSISAPRLVKAENNTSLDWWERLWLHRGALRWAPSLIDTFIDSSMIISHHTLECFMRAAGSEQNYVRFALPGRDGLGLDIATSTATQTLRALGSGAAAHNPAREKLARFLKREGTQDGKRAEAV